VTTSRPAVVIGAALHNRAAYLPEAIDSLLAQSFRRFTLILVDDGSTDGTEALARIYERRDSRVRYVRFDERRGMVAAWRKAFEEATAAGAEYFAWGSDHDRWHPTWLATLVDTLEDHPNVVLAYPLTQRIDPDGVSLAKPARQFETTGITDRRVRWTLLSRSHSLAAGDAVYGLMRADALRRAGVFREVLSPDRLLIAELSLLGQIRQVPEVLWCRRQFPEGSIGRQRTTLFAPGAARPSAQTPPWYLHARSIWTTYTRDDGSSLGLSRSEVVSLVVEYSAAYAWRHYGKSSVQRGLLSILGWPRWVYKRLKHAALLALYTVLITLRKAGATPRAERLCARLTGRERPWRRSA
jgi:glycosyltransferase involved in cell wall biosynthesis